MNEITQAIKYKLGFAEEGGPIPEILKNYMDVSTIPPANHPPRCSGPQHNVGQVAVTCGVPIPGGGETCQPPTSQEGKGGKDVDSVGILAPPWLSEWVSKGASHNY